MKNDRHHIQSLLIGALGFGLVLMTMGMLQGQPTGFGPRTSVQVNLAPLPADLITIREGDAYCVPSNRVLVIKTLGVASGFGMGDVIVKVDGLSVFTASGGFGPLELELGVSARGGQIVTLEQPFPDEMVTVVALGFLGND